MNLLNKIFLSKTFFKNKFKFVNVHKKAIIIVFKSSSVITNIFLNNIARVYSGLKLMQFNIEDHHIGKRFGEFRLTKKMGINIHLSSGRNLKIKSKIKLKKKK